MNKYIDSYGRFHDRPVTIERPFPCNNSFTFSGYAHILGLIPSVEPIIECWTECQSGFGFTRNSDNDPLPGSSHDDLVGMAMIAPQLVMKYRAQNWQVCNFEGFGPKPLWKHNPFMVIWNFYKLSREIKPRTSTFHYPYIWPFTFRIAPQHTYFIERCAGLNPSLSRRIYFYLSSLHTIFQGSNSSKVMLGFKLMKLKESKLSSLYRKKVDFNSEVKKYFPADHPIALSCPDVI
ncbi:MAG TPA: hypothetical protein VNJ08_00530 [Bacteriovoracaceae bacterium]|nr:hypothetical protein [Bacteriovoracaceae bacterium]